MSNLFLLSKANKNQNSIRNLAYSLHQELGPKGIYVGTLIIKGFVQEGTYFSGENIADAFYRLYIDRKEVKIVFEGK